MGKKIKSASLALLRLQTSKQALFWVLALFTVQTIATVILSAINPELSPNLVEVLKVTANVCLLEVSAYSLKATYENGKKITLGAYTPETPANPTDFADG